MQIDLWSFANTLYAMQNTEQRCLWAQAQGANVCLILCALWLEWRASAFDPILAAKLIEHAKSEEHLVLGPLRALRTQWKTEAQHNDALQKLRESVKRLELEAEKNLLQRLEDLCCATQAGKPNFQWLKKLSSPVTWKAQELRHWQQLLLTV